MSRFIPQNSFFLSSSLRFVVGPKSHSVSSFRFSYCLGQSKVETGHVKLFAKNVIKSKMIGGTKISLF